MIFNSLDFAIFLPIVFLLYSYVFNKNLRIQNFLIVVASYVFYGWWDWKFLSLILLSTFIDYSVGLLLKNEESTAKRKLFLWTSIGVNIGLLGFFKYYNFFVESFNDSFSFLGFKLQLSTLNIILPVGISFYTFQTLSYTIDTYRRKLNPTKDFIAFSAFVSFFPQLVAGPIERASHLLPQFYSKRSLNSTQFQSGIDLILWGLFKKVVIADRLALFVNEIYNNPLEYNGLTFVTATIFFAFQIYCDFSGYSDIAIGTSKLFGFDLMKNFNTPYFSKSLSEFWRRWHISLSTWFRDYVYIPLGGNKTSKSKWMLNIMIVFVVSGIWHGANWTFIIWGAIHGSFLIIESFSKSKNTTGNRINFNSIKRFLITFFIVCLSWVFFRANSVSDAFHILNNIFNFKAYSISQLSLSIVSSSKNVVYPIDIALSFILIISLVWLEYIFTTKRDFSKINYWYKLPIYIFCVWLIFVIGVFGKNEFIYFQF